MAYLVGSVPLFPHWTECFSTKRMNRARQNCWDFNRFESNWFNNRPTIGVYGIFSPSFVIFFTHIEVRCCLRRLLVVASCTMHIFISAINKTNDFMVIQWKQKIACACCFMEIWRESQWITNATMSACSFPFPLFPLCCALLFVCICRSLSVAILMQQQHIPKPIHEFHVTHMTHYVHVNIFNWSWVWFKTNTAKREIDKARMIVT